MDAKILFLDVETSPNIVHTWGLFKQNIAINQIVSSGYMLCWSAKWLGDKKIMHDSLIDHTDLFKKDPTSSYGIAKTMWKLLDEADVVVAHNGDGFDLKWLNSIFLDNRLGPPSPFKTIDTLKIARFIFYFPSNKLDYITERLGLGTKLKHEGHTLWTKCMRGEKGAFRKMIRYNRKDVLLLEKVYLEMRPYMKNHPNMGLYISGEKPVCTVCQSTELIKRGTAATNLGIFQRFRCKCGKWVRGRDNLLTKTKRKSLLTNAI